MACLDAIAELEVADTVDRKPRTLVTRAAG